MLRAVPCVLLSVSLAMGGLVKQLHGLIARATAGERQAEDGGSRAVWQYRGSTAPVAAPPLITSDLVVSPFQVEPPSDVTATGARHTVQLVHLCEDVCRCMFLRPLAGPAVARQFLTDRH